MEELRYKLDLLEAMNRKLSEKERMYRMVCDSSEGAYLYFSFEKRSFVTLGQWNNFFDFQVHDSRDFSRLLDTVEESGLMPLRDVLYLEKSGEKAAAAECRRKEKKAWIRFDATVSYDAAGQPVDKVIHISDTTRAHVQNEELMYMAYYDALTGLCNRNYFIRLLSEFLDKAADHNAIVSVMIVDIDEFRKINDGLGLVVGDDLVQLLGLYIKDLCNDHVIACHLHTDVFCIAIYEPSGANSVDAVYKAIQDRTKKPFCTSTGQNLMITVGIGVADYPEAAESATELINCAEIMVFKSKLIGMNVVQHFSALDRQEFMREVELEDKLKKAIHNEELFLHYQPLYYAGNRRLRGIEALLRWNDAEEGMINPNVFIPIAEKNGTINQLGKWVLEESIRQFSGWRKQFAFPFTLSINISSVQYKNENFVDFVIETVNKYRVNPSEIELEITESILIDDFETVSERLRMLRNFGIRISMDDFGTGFSSLSYLKKLPIDTLKIDKSFVDTVLADSATRIITEFIINMVKALGCESIAEGVEEEQQYKYLHAIGCDTIQGFLFNRPMPPEQLEELLGTEL